MRRLGLALAVVLAVALVVIVAWREVEDGADERIARQAASEGSAETLRDGDAPSTPPPAPTPALRGGAPESRETAPAAAPSSDDPLPFRIDVVDAETGRPVGSARADVDPPVVLRPGDQRLVSAQVSAPDGWIAHDAPSWVIVVSRRATALQATLPLRREADVRIAATDVRGNAAAGTLQLSERGSAGESSRISFDTLGRLRVSGIPYFRGEALEMGIAAKRSTDGVPLLGVGRTRLPQVSDVPAFVRVDLRAPSDGLMVVDTVDGFAMQRFRAGYMDAHYSGVQFSMHSWVELTDTDKGSIEVTVSRRDGSRAPGASVSVALRRADGKVGALLTSGRTDADGCLRMERMPRGDVTVLLREPGMLPVAANATVTAGTTARVELTEPQGGDVRITVVDKDDVPVPFAMVTVEQPSGLPWLDVSDDGVQRVDDFTDHLGVRRFGHLEPGRCAFEARWASRHGRTKVDVVEGETAEVRLVVR